MGSWGWFGSEKEKTPGDPGDSILAEEVGFEPTEPCGSTVFKTAAFNHSAIPPYRLVGYHIMMLMNDEEYMRMALEEAQRAAAMGEVPIGAVVVYGPID